jgi:hypothetical protein
MGAHVTISGKEYRFIHSIPVETEQHAVTATVVRGRYIVLLGHIKAIGLNHMLEFFPAELEVD